MGEKSVTEYFCDRCHKKMKKEEFATPREGGKYTIRLISELEWSQAVCNWYDMCQECNEAMGLTIKRLVDDAKELRKKNNV